MNQAIWQWYPAVLTLQLTAPASWQTSSRTPGEAVNEQGLAQQVLQLGAARIFVYDLGAAHAFYTGKLGLRLMAGGDRLGYLVYDAGHTQLIVEAVAPDASEDEHALVGRFTGLSFYVADIAAAHTVLLSLDVYFSSPPAAQAWGGILATFADAADNQLNLVQLGIEAA